MLCVLVRRYPDQPAKSSKIRSQRTLLQAEGAAA